MVQATLRSRHGVVCRVFSTFLTVVFSIGTIYPPQMAQAQVLPMLPLPGTMVTASPGYIPALIKGITIHPENPLQFDFIVDNGHSKLHGQALEDEALTLIKYFLASLTVPENELWVNLSPYESGRVISEGFGKTEMGMNLLAQDYILKQLTASLVYPENETGKKFWDKVRSRAQKEFGTTDVSMDNFHKVWIVPQDALVMEDGNSAYVIESKLRVMMEQDYFAMQNSKVGTLHATSVQDNNNDPSANALTALQTEIMREIILPEIEKEVNEGQNFAQLRQIYQSLILATWFKKTLKESLLGQVYVDRNKVKGVDTDDPALKQKIYDQYVKAFEQGVYNYIKEEVDPVTNQVVPRQYFSGGLGLGEMSRTQRSVRKIELSGSRRGAAARAMRPAGDDVVRMGTNLVENLGKGDQEDLQEQALARRGSTDGRRDKAMLVEKTVTVLEKVAPQALADVRAGLFTPEQMAALDLVVEVGQEHTVALAWQAAGDDAAKKKAYLDQVALRNQTYPTGLKGYVVTHRQKLADKKAEKNPYAGMRLRLTQKVDNSRVDEKYWAAMDRGIEEAGDMVIMLAQGGVGDRLAWKTERKIKTDLTMDPILDMSYMERFIRDILAIQEAANERREAKGLAPVQIPYVHMVSGQTAAGLQKYLTDNKNFGMDGMSFIDVSAGEKAVFDPEAGAVVIRTKDGQTRALGQLVLFKQEDVFAANNWEGTWVMNPPPTAQEIERAKKEGKTIESKTHLVMEKAHNHGDLNMLMHMSRLAKAYKDAGKKHIMYHQDTNAETFRAAVPGLGNMVAQGKKLNIVVVPIKLGEKAGSVVYMLDATVAKDQIEQVGLDWSDVFDKLTKNKWAQEINSTEVRLIVNLEQKESEMSEIFGDKFLKILPILQQALDAKNGKGFVRNVEYSDIQQVFGDPYVQEDLKKEGLKPEQFNDGNINVFLMDLETYADILEAKNGLLGEEIVNPKADTLVSRLEAMVQDAYIDFDPADVMVNSFDSRFVFDAAKNSVRNALIAVAGGLFPENTTVAIAHNQRNNRVLLKENTGVEMNVDAGEALALPGEYKVQTWKARGEKKVFVVGWDGDAFPNANGWALTDQKVMNGIPYPTGAHVSWTPDWARTADEVREKWQGGRIDDEATVGIKGKNIFFRNVQVEGSSTLIVKANPDQTLTVENLTVRNNGWRYRMLTREEALNEKSGFSEFERMWGFRVLKDEQMVIDLTSLPAGNYRVNEKGEVASVDAAMLSAADRQIIAQRILKRVNDQLVSAFSMAGFWGQTMGQGKKTVGYAVPSATMKAFLGATEMYRRGLITVSTAAKATIDERVKMPVPGLVFYAPETPGSDIYNVVEIKRLGDLELFFAQMGQTELWQARSWLLELMSWAGQSYGNKESLANSILRGRDDLMVNQANLDLLWEGLVKESPFEYPPSDVMIKFLEDTREYQRGLFVSTSFAAQGTVVNLKANVHDGVIFFRKPGGEEKMTRCVIIPRKGDFKLFMAQMLEDDPALARSWFMGLHSLVPATDSAMLGRGIELRGKKADIKDVMKTKIETAARELAEGMAVDRLTIVGELKALQQQEGIALNRVLKVEASDNTVTIRLFGGSWITIHISDTLSEMTVNADNKGDSVSLSDMWLLGVLLTGVTQRQLTQQSLERMGRRIADRLSDSAMLADAQFTSLLRQSRVLGLNGNYAEQFNKLGAAMAELSQRGRDALLITVTPEKVLPSGTRVVVETPATLEVVDGGQIYEGTWSVLRALLSIRDDLGLSGENGKRGEEAKRNFENSYAHDFTLARTLLEKIKASIPEKALVDQAGKSLPLDPQRQTRDDDLYLKTLLQVWMLRLQGKDYELTYVPAKGKAVSEDGQRFWSREEQPEDVRVSAGKALTETKELPEGIAVADQAMLAQAFPADKLAAVTPQLEAAGLKGNITVSAQLPSQNVIWAATDQNKVVKFRMSVVPNTILKGSAGVEHLPESKGKKVAQIFPVFDKEMAVVVMDDLSVYFVGGRRGAHLLSAIPSVEGQRVTDVSVSPNLQIVAVATSAGNVYANGYTQDFWPDKFRHLGNIGGPVERILVTAGGRILVAGNGTIMDWDADRDVLVPLAVYKGKVRNFFLPGGEGYDGRTAWFSSTNDDFIDFTNAKAPDIWGGIADSVQGVKVEVVKSPDPQKPSIWEVRLSSGNRGVVVGPVVVEKEYSGSAAALLEKVKTGLTDLVRDNKEAGGQIWLLSSNDYFLRGASQDLLDSRWKEAVQKHIQPVIEGIPDQAMLAEAEAYVDLVKEHVDGLHGIVDIETRKEHLRAATQLLIIEMHDQLAEVSAAIDAEPFDMTKIGSSPEGIYQSITKIDKVLAGMHRELTQLMGILIREERPVLRDAYRAAVAAVETRQEQVKEIGAAMGNKFVALAGAALEGRGVLGLPANEEELFVDRLVGQAMHYWGAVLSPTKTNDATAGNAFLNSVIEALSTTGVVPEETLAEGLALEMKIESSDAGLRPILDYLEALEGQAVPLETRIALFGALADATGSVNYRITQRELEKPAADGAMLAEVEKRLQEVDELIKSFIETDARLSTYDAQEAQDFKDDLDVALSDARGALVQADNVLEREPYISPAAKRRLSVLLVRLSSLRALTSLIAAKDSRMYFSADYDQVDAVKASAKALLEKVNRMPVMMTGEAQRAVIDLQAAIVASIAADFEGWNKMSLAARKSFLVGFISLAESAAEALAKVSGQLDKTRVLARTVQKQMGKDLDALAAHVEAVRKQLNKDTDVEDADLISSLREQLTAVAKAGREIRQKIAGKKPVDEAMLTSSIDRYRRMARIEALEKRISIGSRSWRDDSQKEMTQRGLIVWQQDHKGRVEPADIAVLFSLLQEIAGQFSLELKGKKTDVNQFDDVSAENFLDFEVVMLRSEAIDGLRRNPQGEEYESLLSQIRERLALKKTLLAGQQDRPGLWEEIIAADRVLGSEAVAQVFARVALGQNTRNNIVSQVRQKGLSKQQEDALRTLLADMSRETRSDALFSMGRVVEFLGQYFTDEEAEVVLKAIEAEIVKTAKEEQGRRFLENLWDSTRQNKHIFSVEQLWKVIGDQHLFPSIFGTKDSAMLTFKVDESLRAKLKGAGKDAEAIGALMKRAGLREKVEGVRAIASALMDHKGNVLLSQGTLYKDEDVVSVDRVFGIMGYMKNPVLYLNRAEGLAVLHGEALVTESTEVGDGGPAGAVKADQAMVTSRRPADVQTREVGGIDLNPALLDLKIKRDGNGIPLPMPQQSIEELMEIEGFLPVIINVTPVENLPMLLGLEGEGDSNKEETIAKLSFYRKIDVYEYRFVVREEV